MSFVFVLSSDAQCTGECSPTLQSHTVDEFYLLKRKRTQYKAKQLYFFLSLKTIKAKFKHSMEMSEQTTNFSVIRFYCGLLITLSWDLCSKLQKKKNMNGSSLWRLAQREYSLHAFAASMHSSSAT